MLLMYLAMDTRVGYGLETGQVSIFCLSWPHYNPFPVLRVAVTSPQIGVTHQFNY